MTDEEVQEAEEYSNMLAKRVQELTTELAAANARISELERCCVVGGDGKPIGLRDRKYMWDFWDKKAVGFTVSEIRFVDAVGSLPEKYLVCSADRGPMCEAKDCYSSPESVPEGEKT